MFGKKGKEKIKKILLILKKNREGLNMTELSRKMGVTRQALIPYIQYLNKQGKIKIRKIGPSKLIMLDL